MTKKDQSRRDAYVLRATITGACRAACADAFDRQTGEVNNTALAEAAADALDHDEWLDDETHQVWDIAIVVGDAYERQNSFRL